ALSAGQVGALTAGQVGALDKDQLNALDSDADKVQAVKVGSIDDAQVKDLSTTFLNAMSDTQITAFKKGKMGDSQATVAQAWINAGKAEVEDFAGITTTLNPKNP
ncbi:MAG: hypothetical protein KIG95_09695, partial [Comamonas sp.]|nr:hypothetical protein [Comamonas sp.]